MYPTLSVSFSNPLRKDQRFFIDSPRIEDLDLSPPLLEAEGYRYRDKTYVIHESLPSFGLSFGHIQVACNRTLRGTWRISSPCIIIAYSVCGQVQLAIRGYGDAIGPLPKYQSAAPIPFRTHFFFANAGIHRLYYFTISHGMLELLAEEMPALVKLGAIPHYSNNAPWQEYVAGEEDFRILQRIRETELSGFKKHAFLLQQFKQLMQRYSELIETYGDNPEEQMDTTFRKATRYIRENFQNPNLTIATVAEAVCLSTPALEKTFQRHSFKTIRLINALRAYYGMDLLRDTDLSVADIATLSGFGSRARFTVVFSEKFDLTPKDYRKTLKNNKKTKK